MMTRMEIKPTQEIIDASIEARPEGIITILVDDEGNAAVDYGQAGWRYRVKGWVDDGDWETDINGHGEPLIEDLT